MSYYDMDDLLSEEFDTNSQIHVAPYVDPENESEFFLSFRNVKTINLPMWLTYELQKRSFLIGTVPTFLNAKGLSGILNSLNNQNTQQTQLNLSQYDPFFYTLAFKILNYYSTINERYRVILTTVLRVIFLKRFRDHLAPQADNRGVKNVSMKFLEELPEFERSIFKHLERDFSSFHKWRTNDNQSSIATAELPIAKRFCRGQ